MIKVQPWRDILVPALNGADVPTRPETAKVQRPARKRALAKRTCWTGKWQEVKGCRFNRLADDQTVQVLSWHQGRTDAAAAVRLCVMANGVRWLVKPAQASLSEAVEMLGKDHWSESVHQIAALLGSAHPKRERKWNEAARARLFQGEVHGIMEG